MRTLTASLTSVYINMAELRFIAEQQVIIIGNHRLYVIINIQIGDKTYPFLLICAFMSSKEHVIRVYVYINEIVAFYSIYTDRYVYCKPK